MTTEIQPPEPSYEVTVRVTVRDAYTGRQVAAPAVAAISTERRVTPARVCEAAAETVRAMCEGRAPPGSLATRAQQAIRDVARSPSVARAASIAAAGLHRAGDELERIRAQAAARLVVAAPETDEDPL